MGVVLNGIGYRWSTRSRFAEPFIEEGCAITPLDSGLALARKKLPIMKTATAVRVLSTHQIYMEDSNRYVKRPPDVGHWQ